MLGRGDVLVKTEFMQKNAGSCLEVSGKLRTFAFARCHSASKEIIRIICGNMGNLNQENKARFITC